MSIHSHHFPLSFNTSSFMHIHFKFQPNISPTQLTKHTKKGYLIVVTQEPTIGSFAAATKEPTVRKNLAAATQEPAVRKESLLLPHKNQQYKTVLCCHIKIMRRNKAADTHLEREG